MQRHRFFAHPSHITASRITLDAAEAHHLSRVLRLRCGARVFVFDGAGAEFECEIARASSRSVELLVIAELQRETESPLRLTLGQALIKGDKFDLVIQKAAELGVTRIVPLATEHSDVQMREGRADNRLTRWRRIALEAARQCGRCTLVEIAEPKSFAEFCEVDDDQMKLIFSEQGGHRLEEIVKQTRLQPPSASICIGPEGGWSQAELNLAEAHGFIPVHLGARILRTETAAIAAVSLIQHLFGDLK
jgi:16S rRNA (uracil1498-N3)-methyltransferase